MGALRVGLTSGLDGTWGIYQKRRKGDVWIIWNGRTDPFTSWRIQLEIKQQQRHTQ